MPWPCCKNDTTMSETFRITFLGTSAAVPTVRRNVSATLIVYQDLKWLVDCGEGTQRQILRPNIGFKNLSRIVLSHEHLDHILGMGGLLATLNMLQPVDHVIVYGSPAVLERVRQMSSYIGRPPQYDLQLQVLQEGLVFTHRQLACYAFPTRHRLKHSYGFVFQEQPRRRFLPAAAAAMRARDAGVAALYLNHVSQRYAQTEYLLLEEARRIFSNTHLANDLDTIGI